MKIGEEFGGVVFCDMMGFSKVNCRRIRKIRLGLGIYFGGRIGKGKIGF